MGKIQYDDKHRKRNYKYVYRDELTRLTKTQKMIIIDVILRRLAGGESTKSLYEETRLNFGANHYFVGLVLGLTENEDNTNSSTEGEE